MKIVLNGDFSNATHFLAAKDAIDRFKQTTIINIRNKKNQSALAEMTYVIAGKDVSFMIGATDDGFVVWMEDKVKNEKSS